jgi:hypothetical protein
MIHESSEKSGLALNKEKLKGPAESITAFNIDLSCNLVAINDSRFNELLSNYKNASSDKQRTGIWGYVNSVNPAQAAMLIK